MVRIWAWTKYKKNIQNNLIIANLRCPCFSHVDLAGLSGNLAALAPGTPSGCPNNERHLSRWALGARWALHALTQGLLLQILTKTPARHCALHVGVATLPHSWLAMWWNNQRKFRGETSVLRTFRMSGKELVKERVSKERVRQRNS